MSRFGKLRFAAMAAVVLLAVPNNSLTARADDSSHSEDDKAIRAQAGQYPQLFLQSDAAALANMWTADGLLTDSDGHEYKGRAAIQNAFVDHFKKFGPHKLEVNITSLKFPSANTAIEEGTTRAFDQGVPMNFNRYLAVHVKENGQWYMAAVNETSWTPESSYAALKDLNWMVGKWSVKQPTATGIHFNADWVANHNFIKCEFTEDTKPGSSVDPVKTTNIIGWDPLAKQIVSWHFDSTGGFGYGRWHKEGQAWVIDANGVEQDGTTAKASYVLNPVDTNMFTWQSTGRRKAGSRLPDSPSISVGRDESVQ